MSDVEHGAQFSCAPCAISEPTLGEMMKLATLEIDATVGACQSMWRDCWPDRVDPGWTQGVVTTVTLDRLTAEEFAAWVREYGVDVV